jgi:hypothetical protein
MSEIDPDVDASMSHEDIEAISGMNRGDFGPVASLLRAESQPHREVLLLLAEFLAEGNSRGRLKFILPKRRPSLSGDAKLNRMCMTYEAVKAYQMDHLDAGLTQALRAVSQDEKPFRSYEAVRADYYEWKAILEGIGD